MENIISDLWRYAEKRNKKIYNWLNCDNLASIIVDNNISRFPM